EKRRGRGLPQQGLEGDRRGAERCDLRRDPCGRRGARHPGSRTAEEVDTARARSGLIGLIGPMSPNRTDKNAVDERGPHRACRTLIWYFFAAALRAVNRTASVAFSERMSVWKGVSSPVEKPSSSLKTQFTWTWMRRGSRFFTLATTSSRPS